MEWIEPIYCAGHWVGEMIELAGGHDSFGRKGSESVRIEWPDLLAWAPEVLVLAPCGFNAQTALAQASLLSRLPGWTGLPAVRQGRVYAVDANSYFARPGPRVIEGTELLAHLIHPALFDWNGPGNAFETVPFSPGPDPELRTKSFPACCH